MKLKLLEKTYAMVRYAPETKVSSLQDQGNEFFSVTKTPNEVSLLCEASNIPDLPWQKIENNWRGFCLDATFAFTEIGILKQVLNPLADAKISILAFATFDTDYVFLQAADFERALAVLQKSGFTL